MEVQWLLGADGHAHQNAQELELEHVLVQAGRRVEEEPAGIRRIGSATCGGNVFHRVALAPPPPSPVPVVADLGSGVGGGDQQVDHARLQLLWTHSLSQSTSHRVTLT